MEAEFLASCVDLKSVLVWAIREQSIYNDSDFRDIEFNIKLDGRPLGGKYFYITCVCLHAHALTKSKLNIVLLLILANVCD